PGARLLLGPRLAGPSCVLPITLCGLSSYTVTWYICAIGRCTRIHVRPWLTEMLVPPSLATIIRSAFVGSIQTSWLSPPGLFAKGWTSSVSPPFDDTAKPEVRKYSSFSLAGDTARCE